uniref:Uncharacterized protein n=1 Tax=Cyprinus carpio TaxID=7962 RepID=A0A8C1QR79_CYPCA
MLSLSCTLETHPRVKGLNLITGSPFNISPSSSFVSSGPFMLALLRGGETDLLFFVILCGFGRSFSIRYSRALSLLKGSLQLNRKFVLC